MTNDASKTVDHLETLSRGLALLRCFGEGHDEMSIQEAAEFLSISRGAARRFLITLMNEGYLTKYKRNFRISPKVLELGYSFFSSLDLPTIAQPLLDDLSDRTGETCGLYILHRDAVVVIGASTASQSFTFAPRRGTSFPAYATTVGRLLLADLPMHELDTLIATMDLQPLTSFTVTSKASLRKAIDVARDQGYAVVSNELVYGMAGVALPVRDADGRWIAAINITLQRGETTGGQIESSRRALNETADQISDILAKLGRRGA